MVHAHTIEQKLHREETFTTGFIAKLPITTGCSSQGH